MCEYSIIVFASLSKISSFMYVNTTFPVRDTNVEKIPKDKESNKFDQCNFKSNKEITLIKHMNTKHGDKVMENDTEFECSLCKDRVNTNKELDQQIAEHIQEIENMDIETLTNWHDLFECNLCSFEYGHEDSAGK